MRAHVLGGGDEAHDAGADPNRLVERAGARGLAEQDSGERAAPHDGEGCERGEENVEVVHGVTSLMR